MYVVVLVGVFTVYGCCINGSSWRGVLLCVLPGICLVCLVVAVPLSAVLLVFAVFSVHMSKDLSPTEVLVLLLLVLLL